MLGNKFPKGGGIIVHFNGSDWGGEKERGKSRTEKRVKEGRGEERMGVMSITQGRNTGRSDLWQETPRLVKTTRNAERGAKCSPRTGNREAKNPLIRGWATALQSGGEKGVGVKENDVCRISGESKKRRKQKCSKATMRRKPQNIRPETFLLRAIFPVGNRGRAEARNLEGQKGVRRAEKSVEKKSRSRAKQTRKGVQQKKG